MTRSLAKAVDVFMVKSRKYGELIVAVVIFLFFLLMRIFIGSFMDLSVQRWKFVSPAFWPGWILLLGAVLAGLLLFNVVQKIRTAQKCEEGELTPEDCRDEEQKLRDKFEKEGKVLSIKELEALAAAQIAATEEPGSTELFRLLGVVLLTFLYLYVIRVCGFITSTLLFSFAYLFLLKERRPLVLTLCPLVLVSIIWFVFTKLLVVPLPRGIGIFQSISNLFY